jgi:hypothetical protein
MGRCLLPLLMLAGLLAQAAPLLDESFEGDEKALRDQGWSLPEGATVVTEGKNGTRCLRLECPDGKAYSEFFVPVKTGCIYRARAWVRCENVADNAEDRFHRGAALFCQFADRNRQWKAGGSFPTGLKGTQDWRRLEVRYTSAIPEGVAFIQLMIGVEGTGTAWFDGVEVEEITAWDSPKAVAPQQGETVASRRPLLRWEADLPEESYELELSPSPDFPAAQTQRQRVWADEARPDAPLTPGVWHWRLRTVTALTRLPPTKPRSFTVPPDAAAWPPRLVPRWTNDATPQPTLAADLVPADWVTEIRATIGGQTATVERDGERVRITAAAKLPKGVFDVHIVARGPGDRQADFHDLFCHKKPAIATTFREDGIMLVDGKPFFPIGSYRDPSDTLTDFAGLRQAGFNVTHDYYFENAGRTVADARAYLRAAHENELRVFLGSSRPAIRRGDVMRWKRWTGELMDEPALLTWYMMDEPICQKVPQAAFVQLQQAIRQMDSGHPASLLLARIAPVTDIQRAYAETCDILWCDPYPIPSRSLNLVREKAEACRDAAGPNRPFWVVLQGFDWRYWNEKGAAFEKYGQEITRPTPDETRAMAHLALSSGAHGLVWYWSPKSCYQIQRQAPTVWQGICDTVQELNRLHPYLVAPRSKADAIDLPAPFQGWSRTANGARVLAIVNASDEAAKPRLPAEEELLDWRTGKPPTGEPIPAWGTDIYTWRE